MRLTAITLLLAFLCAGCERSMIVSDDLEEARIAIQAHNWTLAERLLERYLRLQFDADKRWDAWQRLLDVAVSAGTEYRTLLEYLEAMLHEYADNDQRAKIILFRMGELNENVRRFDSAVDVWSTYIDLQGLSEAEAVTAHRRLARLHFRFRRFEVGEDVLQGCLALAMADIAKAYCLYDLADMNIARERWEEATALALQLLELDIDPVLRGLTAYLLGDALEQQNKLHDALDYFEQARAHYPNAWVVEARIVYLKKNLK